MSDKRSFCLAALGAVFALLQAAPGLTRTSFRICQTQFFGEAFGGSTLFRILKW